MGNIKYLEVTPSYEKEFIYITVQELKYNNLLIGKIINPKDESEMDGYIKITGTANDYMYTYFEKNSCPNLNEVYSINYNLDGGIYDGSAEIVTSLKALGSNVEILTPTREGYEFTGWTVNAE